MAQRRSTGKRLRFEVFNRDHFTCQYCGAQPPAVVLVLDHVLPVAKGGGDTADNLVTACEPCNQGKSDRELGSAPVRPDADLMYLQTQQEIAELKRYQDALEAKERQVASVVEDLQLLWTNLTHLDWHPSEGTLRQMLDANGPSITEEAIRIAAPKADSGYLSRSSYYRYLFSVARNMRGEETPWSERVGNTLRFAFATGYFWCMEEHVNADPDGRDERVTTAYLKADKWLEQYGEEMLDKVRGS